MISNDDPSYASNNGDNDNDFPKLEKNRVSAQLSRERKRQYNEKLETGVDELRRRNTRKRSEARNLAANVPYLQKRLHEVNVFITSCLRRRCSKSGTRDSLVAEPTAVANSASPLTTPPRALHDAASDTSSYRTTTAPLTSQLPSAASLLNLDPRRHSALQAQPGVMPSAKSLQASGLQSTASVLPVGWLSGFPVLGPVGSAALAAAAAVTGQADPLVRPPPRGPSRPSGWQDLTAEPVRRPVQPLPRRAVGFGLSGLSALAPASAPYAKPSAPGVALPPATTTTTTSTSAAPQSPATPSHLSATPSNESTERDSTERAAKRTHEGDESDVKRPKA